MKRNVILMYAGLLCLLLSVTFVVSGCSGIGETGAETARRRQHVMKTNIGLIKEDVDSVFMLDSPSKTSDMYIRP